MLAAVRAWHFGKTVADPEGAKRLEQPTASQLLLHTLGDVSRFDCFASCCGDASA